MTARCGLSPRTPVMKPLRVLQSTFWLTAFTVALVPTVTVGLLLAGKLHDHPLAAAAVAGLGTAGLRVLVLALVPPWWALAAALVRRDQLRQRRQVVRGG